MRDDPTVGSLFSGIGGLDLGLERAGFRVAWQCEADPYARAVLAKRWPDVPCYPDVRALGCDVPRVDLVCGGFPCQPVSVAGKRLAQADPRWLWPAFADIIRRLRPPVVLIENVPGLRTAGLRDVLADLAELGFDAEWTIVRASDVGAPHIRARLFLVATDADRAELRVEPGWFSRAYRTATHELGDAGAAGLVADPAECADLGGVAQSGERAMAGGDGEGAATLAVIGESEPAGLEGPSGGVGRERRVDEHELGDAGAAGIAADANGERCERVRLAQPCGVEGARGREPDGRGAEWRLDDTAWRDIRPPEPVLRGVDDGVPARVERLRCLGNAVVPQVAEWVGRQLLRRWWGR